MRIFGNPIPLRAFEWAQWKASRKDFSDPAFIGAVIDLGNCLDLVARENLELVRTAYESFMELRRQAGLPVPHNRSVPGQPNDDRVLRYLDCAVLRHLHQMIASSGKIEAFDTVRGMFTEGGPLYPGAGFQMRTHVQIAVRNPRCILGVFVPIPDPVKTHRTA